MSGWVIFAAILLSLAGLAYLAVTDPKRRRTHQLPKIERRPLLWPARLAVFGPGLYLTFLGQWSGLTFIAVAVSTLGWIMAAITPATYARLRTDLRSFQQARMAKLHEILRHLSSMRARVGRDRVSAWTFPFPRLRATHTAPTPTAEIEALEARITALEARLARLETEEAVKSETAELQNQTGVSSESKSQKKPLNAAE